MKSWNPTIRGEFKRAGRRWWPIVTLTALACGIVSVAGQPLACVYASTSRVSITSQELKHRLAQLQETLNTPAVDAHVNRVWHAVPGLCGWGLDIEQSIAQTGRLKDGHVHLAWRKILPQTSLASLPPEPIYRGPDGEKSMALMFNVSWGEEYLPQILQTLRDRHVHATFFLDGAWVAKHPNLAKRIAREGHAIGSHGTGHPNFRQLSASQLESQVIGTNQRIEHTLGRQVDLLAPPAGAYDERTVRIARAHRMYTILWSVDTVDWRRPPAAEIVQRVVQHEVAGGLVLMHPTAPTVAALPLVIGRLEAAGYHLKTVEDVVHEERAVSPPHTLSR